MASQPPVAGRARSFQAAYFRPPWPAIALSFGQTLPAALAVRAASGGTTRVVHLGRPGGWVKSADLDLVIPMPQDGVAPAANVLDVRMPFNWPRDMARDDTAMDSVGANLPRPCTVFIIGGPTRQLSFPADEIVRLARRVNARVSARRGSLLVSTSPRTPAKLIPALRSVIDVPGQFYAFKRGDTHNPLRGYLQMADEIIVTGDSSSMIAECWRTGKPLLVTTSRCRPGAEDGLQPAAATAFTRGRAARLCRRGFQRQRLAAAPGPRRPYRLVRPVRAVASLCHRRR